MSAREQFPHDANEPRPEDYEPEPMHGLMYVLTGCACCAAPIKLTGADAQEWVQADDEQRQPSLCVECADPTVRGMKKLIAQLKAGAR